MQLKKITNLSTTDSLVTLMEESVQSNFNCMIYQQDSQSNKMINFLIDRKMEKLIKFNDQLDQKNQLMFKTKLFKLKGEKALIKFQQRIRGYFKRKLLQKITLMNHQIEHHKVYKKAQQSMKKYEKFLDQSVNDPRLSLELQKLDNAINLKTTPKNQIKTIQNLENIKNYYAEITDFIVEEQGKNRQKHLDQEYFKELQEFWRFWSGVMDDFEEIQKEEITQILKQNKELKLELKEILEKTTGFKAPPNSEYLNLLAIRKIALKLKTDDAVKYLNFDYFKRKNKEINQQWIKNRKDLLERRIANFEKRLQLKVDLLKEKLSKELNRLHNKRQKQLQKLQVKYLKCQNLISEINAKEKIEQKKNKAHFLLRNDIPQVSYYKKKDEFEKNLKKRDTNILAGLEKKINKTSHNEDYDVVSQRTVQKMYKSKVSKQ